MIFLPERFLKSTLRKGRTKSLKSAFKKGRTKNLLNMINILYLKTT